MSDLSFGRDNAALATRREKENAGARRRENGPGAVGARYMDVRAACAI
jgi:hypothetical protein